MSSSTSGEVNNVDERPSRIGELTPDGSLTSISDDLASDADSPMSNSDDPTPFQYLDLTPTSRLAATKYSAEAYCKRFHQAYAEPHTFRNYHNSSDWTRRGTQLGRARWLNNTQALSLPLEPDEQDDVKAYYDSNQPDKDWDHITTKYPEKDHPVRLIIQGLKYAESETEFTDDMTQSNAFVRAWYYAGVHSRIGGVFGRLKLDNPCELSSEADPVIDSHARLTFRTVKMPGEDFDTGQQGVLYLGVLDPPDRTKSTKDRTEPADEDEALRDAISRGDMVSLGPVVATLQPDQDDKSDAPLEIQYTLPANDGFTLGLIHGLNPVLLSSPRTRENMCRPDGSGLRVSGREQAFLRGSEAYEIHTSKKLGEVCVPVGAPSKEKIYDLIHANMAVELYTENEKMRESLSWLADVGDELEDGEVVVQTLETLVDGEWVGLRERNRSEKWTESFCDKDTRTVRAELV